MKKIHILLIIVGLVLFIIFRIVTLIYNIPTVKNLVSVIGLSLLIPTFIGLIIYSERIKEYRFKLSIFLKGISIVCIVAFSVTTLLYFLGTH